MSTCIPNETDDRPSDAASQREPSPPATMNAKTEMSATTATAATTTRSGARRISDVAEIIDCVLDYLEAPDVRRTWLAGGLWHARAKRRLWGSRDLPHVVADHCNRKIDSDKCRIRRILLRSASGGIYGDLAMVTVLDFSKHHWRDSKVEDYPPQVDLARHCRNLRTLKVDESWAVTDVALIFQRCRNMRHLAISIRQDYRERRDFTPDSSLSLFSSLQTLKMHVSPLNMQWTKAARGIIHACAGKLERFVGNMAALQHLESDFSQCDALRSYKLTAIISVTEDVDDLTASMTIFSNTDATGSLEIICSDPELCYDLGICLKDFDDLANVTFLYTGNEDEDNVIEIFDVIREFLPEDVPLRKDFEFSFPGIKADSLWRLAPHCRNIHGLLILQLLEISDHEALIKRLHLYSLTVLLSDEKAEEYLWPRFREIFEMWRAAGCVQRVIVEASVDGIRICSRVARMNRFAKAMVGFRRIRDDEKLTLLLY